MTIGDDRNKDRFEKLTALRCLKAPVSLPRSDKAHVEGRLFASVKLFVLFSVTREYHAEVLEVERFYILFINIVECNLFLASRIALLVE